MRQQSKWNTIPANGPISQVKKLQKNVTAVIHSKNICPQKVATVTDISFTCLNSISLFSSGMTQDHGRFAVEHISQHSHKNLRTCWTPWSALPIQRLETSRVATKHSVKHCLTNTASNFEAFECDLAHGSFTALALQFTASANYLTDPTISPISSMT